MGDSKCKYVNLSFKDEFRAHEVCAWLFKDDVVTVTSLFAIQVLVLYIELILNGKLSCFV